MLCLLWYIFGRASDLTLVRKQNVSIDASDVFFVRFVRMKTCEEQRLSIFPTNDFATCLDVLDHLEASCGLQSAAASGKDISLTIHSHVNRLLDHVATLARVEKQLTSQSFRRGGA